MKIALGTDHRGVVVANSLVNHLRAEGHEVDILGECNTTSIDYPDVAFLVGRAVSERQADRGILICGTGTGIRAAMAQDELSAQLSRTHNDANVLCLSADLIGQTLAKRVVDVWTKTQFEGGRHQRRLNKIAAIERGEDPGAIKA